MQAFFRAPTTDEEVHFADQNPMNLTWSNLKLWNKATKKYIAIPGQIDIDEPKTLEVSR